MRHYLFIFLLIMSPLISETKILSYNVWFDDTSGVLHRYQRIIDFISTEDADYVCLQEVTPIFLQIIKKSFSNKYYIYNNNIMEKSYGLVLLSKRESDLKILKLSTQMGREALVVHDEQYTLVNVHLESMMEDTFLREQQLLEIKDHTKNSSNPVICGDFNFGDGERENILIEGFIDTGKKTKEHTFNISENILAQSTRFYNEPSRRLDRILMSRSDNELFTFKLIKLNLSDHYPIVVIIKNKM